MTKTATRTAAGDRAATEQALEEAALSLLEKEGVLAGLNLQRVADTAGVNRGLVYHYFGTRRELLRRALNRYVSGWLEGADEYYGYQRTDRVKSFFRAMVRYPRTARLVLLLAMDGDRSFRMRGRRSLATQAQGRDVTEGGFPADVDVEALNIVLMSTVFAYAVRRESFAAELGTTLRDLDSRVETMLVRLVGGLKTPASDGHRKQPGEGV